MRQILVSITDDEAKRVNVIGGGVKPPWLKIKIAAGISGDTGPV